MKLKNKRTGEMIETWSGALSVQSGLQIRHYATIAELNEEWEDVQERGYFAIHSDGSVYKHMPSDDGLDDEDGEEIGNCFETREEAELAVKKLKAWKRLRDKGFRFNWYDYANLVIDYSLGDHDESDIPQLVNDLDFLFGGGDE